MNQLRYIWRYFLAIYRRLLYWLEIKWIGDSVQKFNGKSLLILRLDSIGDYMLFRNFLPVLRNSVQYRDWQITLCGNTAWKSIAEDFDKEYVDNFIWTDAPLLLQFKYRFQLARTIRRQKFHTVIHPTYSRYLTNDLLVICSGAETKICYSGDSANSDLLQLSKNNLRFTKLIRSEGEFKFEFYRNRDFIDKLLETNSNLNKPELEILTNEKELLILCPGASASSRRWSAQNFARFAHLFKSLYPQTVIAVCGSESDKPIAKMIGNNSDIEILDYTGKLSLTALTKVFAEARLIVTNDSGPFHIAVAMNKRAICISSGNNYGRFVPYPSEMRTRSKTIFPPEMNLTANEAVKLKTYGHANEILNIDSISPDVVLKCARNLILNQDKS